MKRIQRIGVLTCMFLYCVTAVSCGRILGASDSVVTPPREKTDVSLDAESLSSTGIPSSIKDDVVVLVDSFFPEFDT